VIEYFTALVLHYEMRDHEMETVVRPRFRPEGLGNG